MLGWLLGAVLAICDGLVWSELAGAMPGTRRHVSLSARDLPQNEAWRHPAVPVHLAVRSQRGLLKLHPGTSVFSQYVGYFWHGMGWGGHAAGLHRGQAYWWCCCSTAA